MTETYGLKSLKYLLSGLLQKIFASLWYIKREFPGGSVDPPPHSHRLYELIGLVVITWSNWQINK